MPNTFKAKLCHVMSVKRSELLRDNFSSRLLFLSISELTLLLREPLMESLLQETCNKF